MGAFNNYVDKIRGGGGGQKMYFFVHAQGIKTVHAGGGKKWQNSVHVVAECSLIQMPFTNNAEMLLTYELLHVNSKDWDRAKERPVHQPIQKGRPRWH